MYSTDQETFWAGPFGDEYVDRNSGGIIAARKLARFTDILRRTGPITSALELGANVGHNLAAIRLLQPDSDLAGVEINRAACEELERIERCEAHNASILEWTPDRRYDLVFTSGVLIHLNPDRLDDVYDLMAATTERFVVMAEYYSPAPEAMTYRGESDRLYKRDFAGEFLDRHADFELVDYRFEYHRDTFAPDDVTWFVMRRLTPSP